MADDVISFGGPDGSPRHRHEDEIEALFHAHYANVARTAFYLSADWDHAEHLAQTAFLRLWNRWRWRRTSDPGAAPGILQDSVIQMSRTSVRRSTAERHERQGQARAPHARLGPDFSARLSALQANPTRGWPQKSAEPSSPAVPPSPAAPRSAANPAEPPGGDALQRWSAEWSAGQREDGSAAHREERSARQREDGSAAHPEERSAGQLQDRSAGQREDGYPADEEQQASVRLEEPADPQAAAQPQVADRVIDTDQAWRDFQTLRTTAGNNQRKWLTAASAVAALVVVVAVAISALPAHRPGSAGSATRDSRTSGGNSALIGVYPEAITARIPLSGVVSVAGTNTRVWAVRAISGQVATQAYQLIGIDLRTNKITLRRNLGRSQPSIAVGAGKVWLTTPHGRRRGQIVGLDAATGQVVMTLHLPAGGCTYVGYIAGQLFANCLVSGPFGPEFLRISPENGRVIWQDGIDSGRAQIRAIAVAPQSVWYLVNGVRISGLIDAASWVRAVTTDDPAYRGSNVATQSLAYGSGFVWALGSNESVVQIAPATGIVHRVYTARTYDPAGHGGLNFLTVGEGSLWFLDDGYPFSGVLRVSESTGLALGRIPIPAGACGQEVCSQIYTTPGALWVPTQQQLLRIDPVQVAVPGQYPATARHVRWCGRLYRRVCLAAA